MSTLLHDGGGDLLLVLLLGLLCAWRTHRHERQQARLIATQAAANAEASAQRARRQAAAQLAVAPTEAILSIKERHAVNGPQPDVTEPVVADSDRLRLSSPPRLRSIRPAVMPAATARRVAPLTPAALLAFRNACAALTAAAVAYRHDARDRDAEITLRSSIDAAVNAGLAYQDLIGSLLIARPSCPLPELENWLINELDQHPDREPLGRQLRLNGQARGS